MSYTNILRKSLALFNNLLIRDEIDCYLNTIRKLNSEHKRHSRTIEMEIELYFLLLER